MSKAVATAVTRFRLSFYVPQAELEACKAAIFTAGAGHYPGYSECCWTTKGTGQFRPAQNANPHIGTAGGGLEYVEEVKVETVCTGRDALRNAVAALRKAHPYEVAPYEVFKLENTEDL